MKLNDIFAAVVEENERSKVKYGLWRDRPEGDNVGFEAICGETTEWLKAFFIGDSKGPHGEIAELTQVMNVCARRIMFLTGEPDA